MSEEWRTTGPDGPLDPGGVSGAEPRQWRSADFDYTLPEQLIAQRPLPNRDDSRLLVVHKNGTTITHRRFSDLPAYLKAGDVLVRNTSRVLPARLHGRKSDTGGRVELLLLRREARDTWLALVKPGRRLGPGTILLFGDGLLTAQVLERTQEGGRRVKFQAAVGTPDEAIGRLGRAPLPPYIKEALADEERYQTVYAQEAGSAAAPTAGLHFTQSLLARIAEQGVRVADVTLHVGLDTFRPVKAEFLRDHAMHAEFYNVPPETAELITEAHRQGRRIIAVGTTTARTLEAAWDEEGARLQAGAGWTNLFIYPGYRWRVVDALLTNFHLPRSSLMMMVAALLGRDRTLAVYEEAVRRQYRFYSFGDAMLIV